MAAYDMINDFWDSLPGEWVGEQYCRIRDGAGRTDEQLDRLEAQCGFRLPTLYREQFKVQNGGYPKRTNFADPTGKAYVGSYRALYEEGDYAVFDDACLSHLTDRYFSMREWLHNIWSDEEIAENLSGWDVEKLVIISFMSGYSLLCLDYGYRKGTHYDEPQVVCIETEGFEEELRVPTYEAFVGGLVVREENDED